MKFKRTVVFAGILVFCGNTAASNSALSTGDDTENKEELAAQQDHAIHWGYSGSAGPEQWGELSDGYALCSSGKRQSPVNLEVSQQQDLYPLSFNYSSVPLQVVNNGHTLQANYNKLSEEQVNIGGDAHPLVTKSVYQSQLLLGTVPYDLLQLHFHSPSEHASEGERSAMEVHLVHKTAGGNLAVVGVFLKSGKHNATLQKILDNLSSTVNEVSVVKKVQLNALSLLPENRDFYHYSGSLTTPPCSENVNWFVMKQQIEVSAKQVRQFASLVGENARPLQTMHWRTLFTTN